MTECNWEKVNVSTHDEEIVWDILGAAQAQLQRMAQSILRTAKQSNPIESKYWI